MLGVVETTGVEVDPVAVDGGGRGTRLSSCFVIRGSKGQLCSNADRQVFTIDAIVRSLVVSIDYGIVMFTVACGATNCVPG